MRRGSLSFSYSRSSQSRLAPRGFAIASFLNLVDAHPSSAQLSILLLQENAAKKSASDVSKSPPKVKSSGKEEEEEIKSSAETKAAPKTAKISSN